MSHQSPCRCVLWVQFECTLEVGDRLLMLVMKAVVISCKIFAFSKIQCSLIASYPIKNLGGAVEGEASDRACKL